jgi:hypothetical protein
MCVRVYVVICFGVCGFMYMHTFISWLHPLRGLGAVRPYLIILSYSYHPSLHFLMSSSAEAIRTPWGNG